MRRSSVLTAITAERHRVEPLAASVLRHRACAAVAAAICLAVAGGAPAQSGAVMALESPSAARAAIAERIANAVPGEVIEL